MSMPDGFVERLDLLARRAGGKAALARSAGLRASTMQSWWTGADPATSNLAAVAEAAGVTLDWFVRGVSPAGDPAPAAGDRLSADVVAERNVRLECLRIAAIAGAGADDLPDRAEWLAAYVRSGRATFWHDFDPAQVKETTP